ncbi:hypothetical protein [Saccharomonospora cyanea]|uniref:Uncharacterized protein n=1 Tax=Saccharomonospora cyanea NA-134 TaxID=882082 RepID=H5XQL8_9PSEU|nr:hypothetical protein [Saccharomonospora cyanea]EHR59064.1 hypothetical protein SaccyDRAFT_0124 [Saccharomonospora cyanea NA-134]
MACKITHRVTDQQIRFANRDAAERYAEIMGGGVHNWVFTTVPNSEVRQPRLSSPRTVSTAGSPGMASAVRW